MPRSARLARYDVSAPIPSWRFSRRGDSDANAQDNSTRFESKRFEGRCFQSDGFEGRCFQSKRFESDCFESKRRKGAADQGRRCSHVEASRP